jgi:MFS family permease
MVIGTTLLSIIGNIIGSQVHAIEILIAANVCNGVAAAGQLSFGIVLGELVPNMQRGPIITLIFMSSLPFAVFVPIIARKFIDNTTQGWRWNYYLGILFGVITIVLYHLLYHPPTYGQLHVNDKTNWQAVKELDFVWHLSLHRWQLALFNRVVLGRSGSSLEKCRSTLHNHHRHPYTSHFRPLR